MIIEHDVVEAKRNLNKNILKGCKGVVVFVYSNNANLFEVEFVNEKNETLDVLTVNEVDIIKK